MTSRSVGDGSNRGSGPLARQLRTLFAAGSFAGLTDGELLDRYLDRGRSRPESDAEAAFAALIDRHGPMVRRSCRTILGNATDADDAFQGVFLLLARKARSLRSRETVAPWLVETSRRVCRKLLVAASRRRAHEARASLPADAPTTDIDRAALDDRAVLLDEIDRLPPAFRAPILLCALEGRTAAEAARLLGVAEGTIHSRLSRARALLRTRLSRRGLAFVPLPIPRIPPFLPERLVTATVRNASLLSASRLTAIEAPAIVLSLIVSTSRRTLMHSTLLLSLVSAVSLGPLAAGWNSATPSPDEPAPTIAAPVNQPVPGIAGPERLHVRIVDSDGQAATDAVLRVVGTATNATYRPDQDGLVVLPDRAFGKTLIADRPAVRADGREEGPRPRTLGFWTSTYWESESGTPGRPKEIRLRPLADPLRIRVVDESGNPVPGAEATSLSVYQVLRSVYGGSGYGTLSHGLRPDQWADFFGPLVADENGYIKVSIPERLALNLWIAGQHVTGSTRFIESASRGSPTVKLRPAGAIRGIVTDSETGEPVPGVTVSARILDFCAIAVSSLETVSQVTGPDGRYVLPGAKPGVYAVRVASGPDADRLAPEVVGVRVETGRDSEADLHLVPARTLTGRITFGDDDGPPPAIWLGFDSIEGSGGFVFDRSIETGPYGRFSVTLLPGTYRISCRSNSFQLAEETRLVTIDEEGDPEPIRLSIEPLNRSHPWDGLKLGPRQMVETISLAFAVDIASTISQEYRVWTSWSEPDEDRALKGRVVDEAGHPVAGVRVWPLSRSERLELERSGDLDQIRHTGRSATTDRNGFFLLRDRPKGPFELGLRSLANGTRRDTVAAGVTEADFVYPLGR